jgi:nucleotide-binding universal stress UspA family protein
MDDVARRQAARLVSSGGVIELVAASRLTRRGKRALHDRCDGYDLLALGACAEACTAAANAPIPTLIARRCAPGIEVTDTIVVAVDDSPQSSRAAELAGRLAAEHGGTVTILATPPLDRALARAIAASFRILWRATGAAPRVFGEPRPLEQTIPSAAVTLTASLVVLGSGRSQSERRMTATIIGAIGCSVLAVPAPAPTRTRTPSGEQSPTG